MLFTVRFMLETLLLLIACVPIHTAVPWRQTRQVQTKEQQNVANQTYLEIATTDAIPDISENAFKKLRTKQLKEITKDEIKPKTDLNSSEKYDKNNKFEVITKKPNRGSTKYASTQKESLIVQNSTNISPITPTQKAVEDLKESDEIKETISTSRVTNGRSLDIDIDKYISPEFHNKNNVYNLPTSPDNKKYINTDLDYVHTTQSLYKFSSLDFNDELTTPKSEYFDLKHRELEREVQQNLGVSEEELKSNKHEESVEESSNKEVEIQDLINKTKENGTKASLDYLKYQGVNFNEVKNKTYKHKDLLKEQELQLTFNSTYNDTKVIDEQNIIPITSPGEDISPKENKFVDNNKFLPPTSPHTVIETTIDENYKVNSVNFTNFDKATITKPPKNFNDTENSLLSNKIETESIKPTEDTKTKWESTTTSRTLTTSKSDIIKSRGTTKYLSTIINPTQSTLAYIENASKDTNKNTSHVTEQSFQENQIIPIKVLPPTTVKIDNASELNEFMSTLTEEILPTNTNQFLKLSITSPLPTTLVSNIADRRSSTVKSEGNATYSTTIEETVPSTTFLYDSVTTDSVPTITFTSENYVDITTINTNNTNFTNNSSNLEVDILKTNLETSTISSTTTMLEISTIQDTSTTLNIEENTTAANHSIEFTKSAESGSTEEYNTSTSATVLMDGDTSDSRYLTTTEPTTIKEEILTYQVFNETQSATFESTTEPFEYTSKVQFYNFTDVATTPNATDVTSTAPVSTENSIKLNVTTENSLIVTISFSPTPINEEVLTEVTSMSTKHILEVTTKSNVPNTTLTPFSNTSNNHISPKILDDASTEDIESSTADGLEHNGNDDSESNGTLIAIIISCVGAICLIILVGLLIVMRKRQKRFNYPQMCKPVDLDSYNMDNVSVYNSVRRKGAARASKRSYGNPAFDDPTSISHPLNFQGLAKFTNVEEITAEFNEIPQVTARTNELPEGCEVKNRYANVIPLPETRVFLKEIEGYPNSDYINANYITGAKSTKKYYIASQAPMSNTVDDFWRMVWEQQSKVILMLTHLYENGVEKCVDYLPPSEVVDCHRLFGDYQVTLKKRDVKDKYIISSLQLKNMVSNSWREITHLWYLGWPEKGVPTEANSLIAFIIEARSFMKASSSGGNSTDSNGNANHSEGKLNTSPVVVHCSPGTGRTGTIIACDIAIREFELTRQVDIPRIVYRIRRDRASSVQTKEQYEFIYKVITLYATKLTGGALDSL